MNNRLNKTLEELEKDIWGPAPPDSTNLVLRIHGLRKKPLKDFTVEDLRVTIGQSFSLGFLIPLAIEELKQNILAAGNCYEGDLLKNVLSADVNFWKNNFEHWLVIKNLFESNKELFEDKEHRQILKSFKNFELIHHVKD